MSDELRALDAEVAERLFGWRWWTFDVQGVATPCRARYLAEHGLSENDREWNGTEVVLCCDATDDVQDYSSSHDCCALVEAEIERRGLGAEYARQLAMAVLGTWSIPMTYDEMFALLRATPEQRCRAALAACSPKGVET